MLPAPSARSRGLRNGAAASWTKGTRMRICVDFDGCLHDPTNPAPGYRMGQPIPGALDAVRYLLAQGHTVMIHTCRVKQESDRHHVHEWLKYFDFPIEIQLWITKPLADVYIDNKALRFDPSKGGWDQLLFHQLPYAHGSPHPQARTHAGEIVGRSDADRVGYFPDPDSLNH